MDSSSVPNRLDIFEIYRRYCEITSDAYNFEGDGYRPANESKKAKLYRDALSQLLQLIESRVDKRMPILEQIPVLMSRLHLMVDSCEFSRFYNFMFFICRENGQRNITVSRAIMAWKLVLSGRFRLLNQWCSFVEKNQKHNISEDTWRQVLAFSRCVHENLEGYDPEGAWPVLIDEFVEHMYIINGSEDARGFTCSCDSETETIVDSVPGLKNLPGVKRKLGEELLQFGDSKSNMNLKRMREGCVLSSSSNSGSPSCGVEGSLSKGFAELFSGLSCLQFDREARVPYTL
ncbi:hypothetical protein LXL04_024103 [Taraxacum kok-saghyz]